MSEFKVTSITNRDGSHGPQICGIVTFTGSGLTLPNGALAGPRGRGIVGGGHPGPQNTMDFVEIMTTGNAQDFGDLTTALRNIATCASSTRGIFASGQTPSTTNTIMYVTISSSGGCNDFGDLSAAVTNSNDGCLSDNTRGIILFGSPSSLPSKSNQGSLEFITIPTTGDSSGFGELSVARRHAASMASPTRGVFAKGKNDTAGTYQRVIDFVTIQTTGTAVTFGETIEGSEQSVGTGNNTRGLIAGGLTAAPNTRSDTIEYLTIASEGNAQDFGNLSATKIGCSTMSNSTRALIAGGWTGPSPGGINVIDFVTIASTGNATDFGDLTRGQNVGGGLSDTHGGLAL